MSRKGCAQGCRPSVGDFCGGACLDEQSDVEFDAVHDLAKTLRLPESSIDFFCEMVDKIVEQIRAVNLDTAK